MSDWTQLIETGFQKLGELTTKFGPPAIEAAAQVVRVDALGNILWGAAELGGAALIANFILRPLLRYVKSEGAKNYHDQSVEALVFGWIGAIGLGAALVTVAFLAIRGMLDPWVWAALFNPKLALAAKVVHALPGMGQ